jgi:hypothetical protein
VQVKTAGSQKWTTVATLETYPATTATDAKGVQDGQVFEAELATPAEVTAVRVAGRPAEGNNPKAAYTTCAELAAYGGGEGAR